LLINNNLSPWDRLYVNKLPLKQAFKLADEGFGEFVGVGDGHGALVIGNSI